jgi:hypothetical protein
VLNFACWNILREDDSTSSRFLWSADSAQVDKYCNLCSSLRFSREDTVTDIECYIASSDTIRWMWADVMALSFDAGLSHEVYKYYCQWISATVMIVCDLKYNKIGINAIGSGTASQSTPRERRHKRVGLGFTLTIKLSPALCLDNTSDESPGRHPSQVVCG